jgi:nitrate reductase beta subunit
MRKEVLYSKIVEEYSRLMVIRAKLELDIINYIRYGRTEQDKFKNILTDLDGIRIRIDTLSGFITNGDRDNIFKQTNSIKTL